MILITIYKTTENIMFLYSFSIINHRNIRYFILSDTNL